MVAIVRLLIISCACLLGGPVAHAICAIGIKPKIWVGDVATNPQCGADTIQAAINAAVCPNTQIIISAGHVYNEQHLTIVDKSVALVGNAGECGVDPESSTVPVRTISGTSAGSVIAVGGSSNVTLKYLEITGGGNDNNHNSEGGGIFFGGSGSLTLQADTIDRNQADYGGGIDVSPTGSTTLTLLADTLILNNTAGTSGGGIRIEGQTRLFMLTDSSTVSFNDAVFGYGGGIEILGPARADIGSSGDVFVGAVSENKATYGGGIAVLSTGVGDATARIFSTDSTTPVEISQNTASAQGGGVYVQAAGGGADFAILCGQDFRIDLNNAPDGAALFVTATDGDSGSAQFNAGGQCGPESTSTLGAVACAPNVPCNEISGNAAVDAHGNRSNGAVITMVDYESLQASRVVMRQNSGAEIVNLSDGNANNFMQNCLIVDNQATSQIIQSTQDLSAFNLDNCTFANNTIDDGYVIFAIDAINLSNDLFAQPNNSTLDYQSGLCRTPTLCLSVQYIVSSELTSLSNPDFSLQSSTPLFVDDTNSNISSRDYHLQAFVRDGVVTASPAIDFAPEINGEGNDLDNKPRNQDVPRVLNRFGMSDVGAYEMQPIADRIFADAFGDATSLVH
jgi:hypothetical protein